jgi:molybdate transport system substrate-binding protein
MHIAYIDPASGGSSGIYLDGLFGRLGIAEMVRAKAILVPGGLAAERVTRGEADIVLQQASEILPVQGVVLAGMLPAEIQNCTTYAAGLSSAARSNPAARTLIEALTNPQAARTMQAKGMMPAR